MGNANDKREDFTYLELNGEEYRVGNLNPMVGVYIGTKLMSAMAPLISSFVNKNRDTLGAEEFEFDELNFDGLDIQGALNKLNRQDFMEIQTECMKVTDKHTKAGWVPLLNSNGSFAFQPTIKETIKIVIECLKFNLSDFFDGESLL